MKKILRLIHCKTKFRFIWGEYEEIDRWIDDRLRYFPKHTWPECWLVEKASELSCNCLSILWRTSEEKVTDLLDEAITVEKHAEFHTISTKPSLAVDQIRTDVVRSLAEALPNEFTSIEKSINTLL